MTFTSAGQQLMASPNSAFYSLTPTNIEASDRPSGELVPQQTVEVPTASAKVAASLSTPPSLATAEATHETTITIPDDQSARSASSGGASSTPSTATSSLTFSPGPGRSGEHKGQSSRREHYQHGKQRRETGGSNEYGTVVPGLHDDEFTTTTPKRSPEDIANRKRERALIREQRHRSDQRQNGVLLAILGLCTVVSSMSTLLIRFSEARLLDLSHFLTSLLLQICGVLAVGVGLMIGVLDTGDKNESTIWVTRALLFVIVLDFAAHYLIGVLRFGHDALGGELDFIPTSYNPSTADQRVVGSLGLLSYTAYFLALGGGLFLVTFLLHHGTKHPCSRSHSLTAPFYRRSATFFIILLMLAGLCQWVLSVYVLDVLDLPGPLREVEVKTSASSAFFVSEAPTSARAAKDETDTGGNTLETDRSANVFNLRSGNEPSGPIRTVADVVPSVAPTNVTSETTIGGPVQIDPLYVIYYPEINGIVGVLQFLSGFFGFIRCSCQRLIGYEDDGLYQVLMGLLWFATLVLQIVFPLAYAGSGMDAIGQNAPTQAALLVPLLLIPSYLDVKMRTTPESNDSPSRRRRHHDVEDQRSDRASSAMDSISTSQDHTALTSDFRTPPQSPRRRHAPNSSPMRTVDPSDDGNDLAAAPRTLQSPNSSPREVGAAAEATVEATDLELVNATRASEVVMPVLTKPSSSADKPVKPPKPLAPRPLRPGSSASLRTIFDQQQRRRQRRQQQQEKQQEPRRQSQQQSSTDDVASSLSPTPRGTVKTILPPPTNIRRTLHSLLASIDEEQDDLST